MDAAHVELPADVDEVSDVVKAWVVAGGVHERDNGEDRLRRTHSRSRVQEASVGRGALQG